MTQPATVPAQYKVTHVWGSYTMAPCPACGATQRHASRQDPRGPCNITKDLWFCFACSSGGRLSDLGIDPLSSQPIDDTTRELPPVADVANFWSGCLPIETGSPEWRYLAARYRRSDFVIDPSLARALPEYAFEAPPIVGWKRSRRTLILPLYDADGALRNVIGRSIGAAPRIKSMSLIGYSRQGLSMIRPGDPKHIVVAEGEIDFLAWSLFGEGNPTVVGIFAGSGTDWTRNVNRGAEVLISTDPDDAGEKYAKQIVENWKGPACKILRA